MEEQKGTFTYSYSAKQQEEIKKIRQKYIPQEESKMDQLRRLDQSVTKPGTIFSIIDGVLSTLVLGIGMCCVLEWNLYIPGIIIGMAGIVGIAAAYPIYRYITKRQRRKVAPRIIKLTEELMQ